MYGYVLHSITLKFSAKGHGTIIDGTIIENCTVPYRILYCTVPYTETDPGFRRLEAVRLRLGRRLGRGRGASYEDSGHKDGERTGSGTQVSQIIHTLDSDSSTPPAGAGMPLWLL